MVYLRRVVGCYGTSTPTMLRGGACEDSRRPLRDIHPQELGDRTAGVCHMPTRSGQQEAYVRTRRGGCPVGTESHPLVLAPCPDVGMRKSWPEGCRGLG